MVRVASQKKEKSNGTSASSIFCNYINGEWIPTGSKGTFLNINPANTDDIIGQFPSSGQEEVEQAVSAATQAFKPWRLVPPPKRAELIKRAGDLMAERKEDIARLMTREMGKILIETRGDVQEGIDTAYYSAGEGRRLFGDTVPCELPNKFGMSVRTPVGVCGIITPWNFPMAIPTWNIFPALVCGNTIVFKPAEDTPATACHFVEILEEAGIPKGVVNLIHGSGPVVGHAIVVHPKIPLISFTGSSEVGREIATFAGEKLKRVSLELGGKNAQIVMDDADMDLALEGALWGAFGTTGQRCTATSRLILHKKIADTFVKELTSRAGKIRIGNGLEPNTQMGPVINSTQREKILSYINIGQKEDKAKLVCGGSIPSDSKYSKGWFLQPTIFTNVKPAMRIAQEEIFGPVVSVITVNNLEEAIEVHNNVDYGLSSSIYTQDVNAAFRAMRDLEAGITYINGPTIGAEVQLPFGGIKNTGNGHREAGHTVLDIFTEWKSLYIDYSGKLQRAQIDTE